jgi:hypothetical protein
MNERVEQTEVQDDADHLRAESGSSSARASGWRKERRTMFRQIGSGLGMAAVLVFSIGCGAKNQVPDRAARLKEAQERVIGAKTREQREAAQEALKRVQLEEGTGFQRQPQNPSN